jgi:uncharacterized protein YbjT (DUF2867 family)
MTKPLLLVTGATGAVGSEVVRQLVEAGQRVRALVRDPTKAAKLGQTVELVQGDLAKPETLETAFAGVEKAFVLAPTPPIPAIPEHPQLEANAYNAAKQAGTKHIVKVSGSGCIVADFMVNTPFAKWHLESEERLRAIGVAWTILRPGFFSSNLINKLGIMPRGGLFLPTGDGKEAPIDLRDIAAVAVKVLTTPGHEGKIYELTGPELLSFSVVVQKVAAVTGRPLRFVDVPEEAWRKEMLDAGAPLSVVESVGGYFAGVRAGRLPVTSTVADLLGRPARTFEQWAKANVEALLASENPIL